MLEKPDIQDEKIVACLQAEYGLPVAQIAFLPLGADSNSAVYRVTTTDGASYFLKLRGGHFDEASVAVPRYLADRGMKEVIPPLVTRDGKLWASLATFKAMLYPYVDGRNGIETRLGERQWIQFGAALKKLHATDIPPVITRGTPREEFSPRWREKVVMFLEHIRQSAFVEPVAAEMAAFLGTKTAELLRIVDRARQLSQALKQESPEYVLCHADIHAWNLLVDGSGALYLVDWDTLTFAPEERDLMFVGAAIGNTGYPPQEEERLFYHGYGPARLNQGAMAYYRYERIIEDIAVYCQQIFLSEGGGQDREPALDSVRSNFLPGGTLERAYQSDNMLRRC